MSEHVIINQHTYHKKNNRRYEQNDKPSLTVPGQTLSLKELLNRFTRGQSVETFQPVYDDGYYPETDRLDKLEKLDLARSLKGAIQDIQKRPKPQKPDPAPIPEPAPAPNPLETPGGK